MARSQHHRRIRAAAVGTVAIAALTTAAIAPAGARPAAPRTLPASADALISFSVLDEETPLAYRGGVSTPIPSGGSSPVKIVSGHFDSTPGGDAILYRTASGADSLVHLAASGDGGRPSATRLMGATT